MNDRAYLKKSAVVSVLLLSVLLLAFAPLFARAGPGAAAAFTYDSASSSLLVSIVSPVAVGGAQVVIDIPAAITVSTGWTASGFMTGATMLSSGTEYRWFVLTANGQTNGGLVVPITIPSSGTYTVVLTKVNAKDTAGNTLTVDTPLPINVQVGGSKTMPVSSVGADVVNAPAGSVIYVLPDWQTGNGHVKPPGVAPAALSDFTALGFMFGASTNTQIMALDTDSTYFDPATGAPKVSNGVLAVFAGRGVNAVVHYYEMTEMTSPIYADITAIGGVESYAYFDRQGNLVASFPSSAGQAGTSDMFLVEYFKDANNNKVFIVYGFAWKGTYVGGVFFKTYILPNIAGFTHGWYIFRWDDANGNGLPDPYEVNTTPVNYGD